MKAKPPQSRGIRKIDWELRFVRATGRFLFRWACRPEARPRQLGAGAPAILKIGLIVTDYESNRAEIVLAPAADKRIRIIGKLYEGFACTGPILTFVAGGSAFERKDRPKNAQRSNTDLPGGMQSGDGSPRATRTALFLRLPDGLLAQC